MQEKSDDGENCGSISVYFGDDASGRLLGSTQAREEERENENFCIKPQIF